MIILRQEFDNIPFTTASDFYTLQVLSFNIHKMKRLVTSLCSTMRRLTSELLTLIF